MATLAETVRLDYDSPALDPTDPAAYPTLCILPPGPQTACYLPWLKVEVALRYALTFPWTPEAWQEVRQRIPWLPAGQSRIRRAGWLN
jgi:hypothetical protein